MTRMRKGGFLELARQKKAAMRKKPYAESILEELEAKEQESGYAAWCKDGIAGDYGIGKHWVALPPTQAALDAELTEAVQDLHTEGLDIGEDDEA